MPSSSLGWNEEANTMIAPVCWDGYNACAAVVYAWSGGCFDTLRNRLIVWGGGHTDSSDNSIYAINFSGTPNAVRLTDRTAGGCSQPSCDGNITPNSRHTYDLLTYAANADAMVCYGGALAGTGFSSTDLWFYYFGQQRWERKFYTTDGHTPVDAIGSLEYDSVTGRIYYFDGRSLFYYTESTNAWTTVDFSANAWIAGYTGGCIDPVNRKFFLVGNTGGAGVYNLTTGNRSLLTLSGDTSWYNDKRGMAFDPVTNCIIVWKENNLVYSVNLVTNTSTQLTAYSGHPGNNQTNGTYGRWQYSPTSGVFCLVNSTSQNAYTLRLSSATPDTTPPTDPASLTATTASQSQINLAWTASTDAVGPVHYLVERCSGAACSSFTEIASTTTNSYSSLGLTASTLYRYRVRAADGSNNFSGYSNIAQDTTSAADVTPPTDPSSLVATVIAANEIDLGWTGSTDASGIFGYYVERAQGAAGAFSQIAVTSALTYADTTLSQATLYRHKVRAADIPGNFSGYSNITSATTLSAIIRNAGTGETYSTIAAAIADAVSGDVIELSRGSVYPNDTFTIPTTLSNITLRGIGTSGYAHLKWDTGDYRTATTHIPNGQGIIKSFGGGTTILENLEFSGAIVDDGNGAGIRYGGAGNLTLKNVYAAHDNQNGILGQAGFSNTLIIEFSRFETNGYFDGTFYSHNIYIGEMGRFILRHSSSLDPTDGHCVKSRAHYNEIYYNHLSTKNSNGSFELEFPNGHLAIVKGNVIEQGNDSSNSTIISYGAEGLTSFQDVRHEIYIVNNTMYNWRTAGAIYIQLVNSPTIYWGINNERSNPNTFRSGTATSIYEASNLDTSDAEWVDNVNGDFHHNTGSAAIDGGVDPGATPGPESYNLRPEYEVVYPNSRVVRPTVGVYDVGAYEYGTQAPADIVKRIPFSRRT